MMKRRKRHAASEGCRLRTKTGFTSNLDQQARDLGIFNDDYATMTRKERSSLNHSAWLLSQG